MTQDTAETTKVQKNKCPAANKLLDFAIKWGWGMYEVHEDTETVQKLFNDGSKLPVEVDVVELVLANEVPPRIEHEEDCDPSACDCPTYSSVVAAIGIEWRVHAWTGRWRMTGPAQLRIENPSDRTLRHMDEWWELSQKDVKAVIEDPNTLVKMGILRGEIE